MLNFENSAIEKYNDFLTFNELASDEALNAFDEIYHEVLSLKQKIFLLSKSFKYATYEDLIELVKEEFL